MIWFRIVFTSSALDVSPVTSPTLWALKLLATATPFQQGLGVLQLSAQLNWDQLCCRFSVLKHLGVLLTCPALIHTTPFSSCHLDIYKSSSLKMHHTKAEVGCIWKSSSLAAYVQQNGCFLPGERLRILGNSPTLQQLQLHINLLTRPSLFPLSLSPLKLFLLVCPCRPPQPGSQSICTHIVLGFNRRKGILDQEITVICWSEGAWILTSVFMCNWDLQIRFLHSTLDFSPKAFFSFKFI